MPARRWALGACLLGSFLGLTPGAARADEGMWTFDAFPSEKVRSKYGKAPDAAWLERVRLSSVRLAQGCSGSFVSPEGLVLTNHHCALGCIEQLSKKGRDLVSNGFFPANRAAELRCPALELNQLVEIRDVTGAVRDATAGKTGEAFQEARKAVIAELERGCATSDGRRCDVVSLYRGGLYHLYAYRRHQDVRLAFAPELGIAFFGGDPDNFNFPRYVLDFAFLRVYEDGAPLRSEHYLPWSEEGPSEGDLVFVSGHPGSTRRLLTVAQLAYQRDYQLPETLMTLGQLRGRLTRMGTESPELARIVKGTRYAVENGFKGLRGRREALVDATFFASKVEAENELRRRVAADPKLAGEVGDAWGEIATATAKERDMRFALRAMEPARGYGSALFRIAHTLVRWADEKGKPAATRLPELTDAKLPAVRAQLFSKAPIHAPLEIEVLELAFEEMLRDLGPADPFIVDALQRKGPRKLAEQLVRGTRLADVAVRQALFDAGPEALAASKDPMIQFARRVDPHGRRIRARWENEVESVIDRASERIARARFTLLGTEVYPDATFSLRLSYGAVEGFSHLGQPVAPFTDYAGLFARATGEPPFELPAAFVRAEGRLAKDRRLNFVTTNDIIGGNSGSPVIDADGRLVGLVFDGNIYSLGGDYGFDPRLNRAVAVHSGGLLEALEEVWRAQALLREIRGR